MSEDFSGSDNSNKSQFNMGVATLVRINKYLMEMEEFRSLNNFVGWLKKLRSVYFEIIPFLNEKEEEEMDSLKKENEKMTSIYSIDPKISNSSKMGYGLELFEKKIRKLLHKYDLLMPTKSDPRYALLGG